MIVIFMPYIIVFCHDIQWLPISLDCCLLSCYIREMPSGDLCATS